MGASVFKDDQLKQYYNSPVLSDVIICFGTRRVFAHKLALSLATSYFRSAFAGSFQESGAKEMTLYDDDQDAVDGMLRHIYGLDYRTAAIQPGPYFCLRTFAVAGKYDVPSLQEATIARMKEELEDLHKNPKSFSSMVQSIYIDAPSHLGGMRKVAKQACWKRFAELMQVKEFKEMLLEVPELQLELLKDFNEQTQRDKKARDALQRKIGPA